VNRVSRTIGDVSLDVHEAGSGPTLLFLHGEDGLQWSGPVLAELAEHFSVVAPHHPGWGGSTRPEYIGEVRDLALVYAEFLEQLGEPVLVAGCSFGGWVAAELAILRPPALAALALIAPTGVKFGRRDERDFADIWIAGFDELPGIWYGDPAAAPDLSALSDEDYLALAIAQEATARYCWKPYMHNPTLRYWLRRVPVPSMVIAGDRDRFALRPDYAKEYAALIGPQGAELRVLPDAGHRVEEERPAQVAQCVAELAETALGGVRAMERAGRP